MGDGINNRLGRGVLVVGILLIGFGLWEMRRILKTTTDPVSVTPPPQPPASKEPIAKPVAEAVGIAKPPATPPAAAIKKPVVAAKPTASKLVTTKPQAPAPSVPVPAAPPIRQAPPTPPPPPGPQEWKGNDTAVKRSGQIVVRNERQWTQFWQEHHPHEASPEVDWIRHLVVGVYIGARPADPFAVEITGVRTLPDQVVIDYREVRPPPGTLAVNVTVYPYHIKEIPRTTLPIKFNQLAPSGQ